MCLIGNDTRSSEISLAILLYCQLLLPQSLGGSRVDTGGGQLTAPPDLAPKVESSLSAGPVGMAFSKEKLLMVTKKTAGRTEGRQASCHADPRPATRSPMPALFSPVTSEPLRLALPPPILHMSLSTPGTKARNCSFPKNLERHQQHKEVISRSPHAKCDVERCVRVVYSCLRSCTCMCV